MANVLIYKNENLTEFSYNSTLGFYHTYLTNCFNLVDGATYTVIWDDVECTCEAYAHTDASSGDTGVYLGNRSYVKGESTEITEPFCIFYVPNTVNYLGFLALDQEESHSVIIYRDIDISDKSLAYSNEKPSFYYVSARDLTTAAFDYNGIDEKLISGRSYTVIFKGTVYTGICKNFVYNSVVFPYIGDGSLFESMTGEDLDFEPSVFPFLIVYGYPQSTSTSYGQLQILTKEVINDDSPAIAIYQDAEELYINENCISPEQGLNNFGLDSGFGCFVHSELGRIDFIEGESYYVMWDGQGYETTAVPFMGTVCIGNPETYEPFCIATLPTAITNVGYDIFAYATADQSTTSHTVGIYKQEPKMEDGQIFPKRTIKGNIDEYELQGMSLFQDQAIQYYMSIEQGMYKVVIDGIEYIAPYHYLEGASFLGNPGRIVQTLEDNGGTFLIGGGMLAFYDTKEFHTIEVYKLQSEKKFLIENAQCVLKNPDGLWYSGKLSDTEIPLVVGEYYTVELALSADNVYMFTVKARDLSDLIDNGYDGDYPCTILGSFPTINNEDNTCMFGVSSDQENGVSFFLWTASEETTVTVSIYNFVQPAKKIKYVQALPKKHYEFGAGGLNGARLVNGEELSFLKPDTMYMVYWDGVLYNLNSHLVVDSNGYENTILGNFHMYEDKYLDTKEPFVIGYGQVTGSGTMGAAYKSADLTATSHEIAIYEPVEVDDEVDPIVLETKNVNSFSMNDKFGVFTTPEEYPAPFKLVEGEAYTIYCDGRYYNNRIAYYYNLDGIDVIVLGNGKGVGLEDTKEDIAVMYIPAYDVVQFASYDLEKTSHEIGITLYRPSNGILLYKPNGVRTQYGDYKKIKIHKNNIGTVIYSEGDHMDSFCINLDLKNGDQVIGSIDNLFAKSTIIRKPDNLVPSNIVKGVTIAGVTGTYELQRAEGVSF